VTREAAQTFGPQRDCDALTKTKAISKQHKLFKVLHKSEEFHNNNGKTSPTIQFATTEDVSAATSKQRKHRQEMRSRLRSLAESDSNSEKPVSSGMTG